MDFRILLAASLLVFTNAAEILLEIQPNVVQAPEEVTIRCQASGLGVSNMITWYKKQPNEDVDVIGYNEMITNPAYQDRFEGVPPAVQGDEVIFLLNIKTTELGDSGWYGCAAPGATLDDIVYEELAIVVALEALEMRAWRSNETIDDAKLLKDGEYLHVNEGDEFLLQCAAKGSNPPADMSITVNGGSDLSDLFDKVSEKRTEDSIIDPFSFGVVLHDVTMTSKEKVIITEEMNRNKVVCSAHVPTLDPVTVTISPVLKIVPRISCTDHNPDEEGNQVGAGLYEKEVNITCNVLADPEPESIVWKWSTATTNHTLEPGHSMGGVVFTQKHYPDDAIISNSLIFERALLPHFRKYTIEVTNSLGVSTDEVALIDLGTGGSTSGVSGLSISMVTVMMSIVIATIKSAAL